MNEFTIAIKSILPEVTIDEDGVVSLTRNALARLIGVSKSVLNNERLASKLAENLADAGFHNLVERQTLPDKAVAIIIEYYAFDAQKTSEIALAAYRAFAAIGIRKFFQTQKGWEPNPKKTKAQALQELAQIAQEMANISRYVENKPGLALVIEAAKNSDTDCLPGTFTLHDYLTANGMELEHKDKASLGMYLAVMYRNSYGVSPEKTFRRYKPNGSNRYQYVETNVYPHDFYPIVEAAVLGFMTK